MIITKLSGGLGNQLFQYAIGRCLAYKHKTELKLDISSSNKTSHHAFYKLDNFNIQENFANDFECKMFPLVKQKWEDAWVFNPEIFNVSDNISLEGWWQSEKYFLDIEDILRKEFTLKNPLGKNSAAWKEKILSSNCAVSLHVRHGDYLKYGVRYNHRLLSSEHYTKCVNKLEENVSDITIFVFSDDIKWCREHLKLCAHMEFVENCEHSFEEMYLMSLCKHNIISQSTFAWWGAWLNQNPEKKVFAPYPWHMIKPYGKDIISEKWTVIPIENPLWMPPMTSFLIYVENNLSTINFSLSSMLSQNFTDYEIILVDTSTDGSGKILRQVATDEKVTILKVDESTNKFTAWNKALEIACGDYVVFLTVKDIIFPHTTSIISSICNDSFDKKASGRETYLTYDTYVNYIPNIISSTQILEENESGEINIGGIPDRKFSLKADATFQNLNGIAEIEIPHHQKLLALGSQGINGLVGTKFFKRKFLNENKIRFNESEGVDAELKFIVDAFMSTEKITFVPALFYGRLK